MEKMAYTEDDVFELVQYLRDYPEDADKWHHLGVIFLSMNKVEDAENAFRHCLKIDKNNGRAHGDLGSILILKGKTKDAIRHLQHSVKILPETHDEPSYIGTAYVNLQDIEVLDDKFNSLWGLAKPLKNTQAKAK